MGKMKCQTQSVVFQQVCRKQLTLDRQDRKHRELERWTDRKAPTSMTDRRSLGILEWGTTVFQPLLHRWNRHRLHPLKTHHQSLSLLPLSKALISPQKTTWLASVKTQLAPWEAILLKREVFPMLKSATRRFDFVWRSLFLSFCQTSTLRTSLLPTHRLALVLKTCFGDTFAMPDREELLSHQRLS